MLTVERGGWCSYTSEQASYLLRFEDREGRLAVAEVHVRDAENMGEALRDLPLRKLEALANAPSPSHDALIRALQRDATRINEAVNRTIAEIESAARAVMEPVEALSLRIRGAKGEPGQKRPDEFYENVHPVHDLATAQGKTAADIARANGVPLTSVYRWLKEARARGVGHGWSKAKATVIRKGEER